MPNNPVSNTGAVPIANAPISVLSVSPQTTPARASVPRTQPAACPVCSGLECLCRPRYFAGQLLTESELNAEQQYVIKKNRMHNLYLHGTGVVCGMEVICHPSCAGWVRLKEGYAISPCGDDIVVCGDTDFDVLGRIRQCVKERGQIDANCSPWSSQTSDCSMDGCWYLTIEYAEQATRPITALRTAQRTSVACSCRSRGCTASPCGGCGCPGCNGNGNGGTKAYANGGTGSSGGTTYGQQRTGMPSGSGMPWGPAGPACEPSRICEGFKLDVCQAPTEERKTYGDLFAGTLLEGFYRCYYELRTLAEGAPDQNLGMSDSARYSKFCQYKAQVRTFFSTHDLTRCELVGRLDAIVCQQPNPAGEEDYAGVVAGCVDEIANLLTQYLKDCVCSRLLPPCPVDTGDSRLFLACVNVVNGEITEICNWQGRQIVMTWPTLRYWLPIDKVLMQFVEKLCCGELGFGVSRRLVAARALREDVASDQVPSDPAQLLAELGAMVSPLIDYLKSPGG